MSVFTKFYRLLWLLLFILIVFLDRNNFYWVISTILLLIILASLAVLRALESRNQWRKYIEDEDLDEGSSMM